MCKPLLLNVLGLLCFDNLTKCESASNFKTVVDKNEAAFNAFTSLTKEQSLCALVQLVEARKNEQIDRTNSNTSKRVE